MTGVAGYVGEVGHIPVDPTGTDCRCGSIGCWETVVGEGRLLTLAGHPADGGSAAVDAVLREAAAGDRARSMRWPRSARWLGFGLAGLVNILNPELIVLGGRFERLYPFVVATIEARLDRLALPASRALVSVVPATLGADAVLLGAAELAFDPILADPAAWLGPRVAARRAGDRMTVVMCCPVRRIHRRQRRPTRRTLRATARQRLARPAGIGG